MSRIVVRALVSACALAALAACAPSANPGHAATADGVRFDYALGRPASSAGAHTYRLSLKIADAASGAHIDDANVAVGVFGPGYDGSDFVNLKREGEAYAGDVVLPTASAYRLTFQVNRKPPAASAVAIFQATPPV